MPATATTFFLNSLKMDQHHFSEELRLEVESRSAHHQHYDEMVKEFRHEALMHEIQEAGQARVRSHKEHDQVSKEVMFTFEMLMTLVKSMGGSLSPDETKKITLSSAEGPMEQQQQERSKQQQQQHANLMTEIKQHYERRDPIKEHHSRLMLELHHYKSFYHPNNKTVRKQKLLHEIRQYAKMRDAQKLAKRGMLHELKIFFQTFKIIFIHKKSDDGNPSPTT